MAARGDVAAFEALYARHHLALLSFCRHMLGRPHDAEDVVQHTFLAADRMLRAGKVPASVPAWLYTVARNRCISLLRARRDEQELPDRGLPSTENLAFEVEQREHLRELLADLRTLPDDQRAALLLAELGDLTHAEVAAVIGVRVGKVKALVFQARQTLMAAADARAVSCHGIREELAVASGAALRRRRLRDHLARCEGCRAFSDRVRGQRAALGLILPVVPTAALRETVFACLQSGSGAAATAGGAGAGLGMLASSTTAAKLLAIAAIGGTAAGGSVAVSALDGPHRAPRAPTVSSAAKSTPAPPVRDRSVPAVPTARRLVVRRPTRDRSPAVRHRAAVKRPSGGTHPPAVVRPAHANGNAVTRNARPAHDRHVAQGRALGHAKQPTRNHAPPGRSRSGSAARSRRPQQVHPLKSAPVPAGASPHGRPAAPRGNTSSPSTQRTYGKPDKEAQTASEPAAP